MPPKKIQGAEYTVGKIFSDDFAFEIADYQRPYAWKTEQAGELLDDLLTALRENNGVVEDANPYFLGSIVLIKGDDSAAEIVDGQQRLTTLTILLAAIRSVLQETKFFSAINKHLYQAGDPITQQANSYRLLPRPRDRDFFRQYIQDEPGIEQLASLDVAKLTESRINFKDNALFFREKLTKLTQAEVISLLQFIITRCFLVVVTTPDLTSAYRIFSVMNSRGMDLLPTDIFKAEVIGAMPEHERAKYAQIWEDEEEELGREAFRELFAHIRTIYAKAKPQKTLLEEFRTAVKPTKDPKHFIEQVMKPYSEAYESIRSCGYESSKRAEEINTLFSWLNKIDNFDWVPPALLFLARNQNNPDQLVKFFTDLERLAAGMMIMRIPLNNRLSRYSRLLSKIEGNEDLYASESPLQLSAAEETMIVAALNGDVYLMQPRIYILTRLDAALSDGGATYDHGILSVEHVLPQNPPPNGKWQAWFPTEDERMAYVHKLGNLLLLSRRKNSHAQNYEFDQKKQRYFSGSVANFALTNQVHNHTQWTREVIEQRQQALISKLKEVWRL